MQGTSSSDGVGMRLKTYEATARSQGQPKALVCLVTPYLPFHQIFWPTSFQLLLVTVLLHDRDLHDTCTAS